MGCSRPPREVEYIDPTVQPLGAAWLQLIQATPHQGHYGEISSPFLFSKSGIVAFVTSPLQCQTDNNWISRGGVAMPGKGGYLRRIEIGECVHMCGCGSTKERGQDDGGWWLWKRGMRADLAFGLHIL
jgi:hypothetical protein